MWARTITVLVFALLASTGHAYAGELGLDWDWVDHPPPPYTYIVLRDGQPWTLVTNLVDPDPNDPTSTGLLVVGLPPGGDCTPSLWQVQAANQAGASDPTAPISSLPRPSGPNGQGVIDVVLNTQGVHQILGDYFPLDIQVAVDGVPVPQQDVTRLTCQLVHIPPTPGMPITVCVTNPSLPNSPSCWNQPPPLSPTGLGAN